MHRFWSKVIADGTGCFQWTAFRDKEGYGYFRKGGKPRTVKAHRFAWTLLRGEIPHGRQVLHSCDNPGCCNVEHLFLGNNSDNVADRVAKGRSKSFGWKLGAGNARIIRSSTKTMAALADEFGIAISTVKRIRSRTIWKNL